MLTPEQDWQLLTKRVFINGVEHCLKEINIGGVWNKQDFIDKVTPQLPRIPTHDPQKRFVINVRFYNFNDLTIFHCNEIDSTVESWNIEVEFSWNELRQSPQIKAIPETGLV